MKTTAVYGFTEVLPRSFLASTVVQSWCQEDAFSKEPVRQMIIAMTTNQAYLGTNRTNPFRYRAFNFSEVTIYPNGLPIVGTLISTAQRKQIYYNTIEALDFLKKGTGHGIPAGDYDNHFL